MIGVSAVSEFKNSDVFYSWSKFSGRISKVRNWSFHHWTGVEGFQPKQIFESWIESEVFQRSRKSLTWDFIWFRAFPECFVTVNSGWNILFDRQIKWDSGCDEHCNLCGKPRSATKVLYAVQMPWFTFLGRNALFWEISVVRRLSEWFDFPLFFALFYPEYVEPRTTPNLALTSRR